MSEELFASVFETSLIGGAFVYMLYYITRSFTQALDKIVVKLENMDARLERLERRGGE